MSNKEPDIGPCRANAAPKDSISNVLHASSHVFDSKVADGLEEGEGKDRTAALDKLYTKTSRTLIPLCLSIIIFYHINRSNLAYASLQINADLGFSPTVYGMGTSLFSVGFVLFQIPSNLILLRVGARLWLAVLTIGWGIVATCTAFITNKASFYGLRILLGAFEAGAVPGLWHYLSLFYPADRITKPYAWVNIGILLATVIGAPLAAGLLSMDGMGGLQGWQWLFMLEGIPSIIIGGVVLLVLPSTAQDAKWLAEEEREMLMDDINLKANEPMSAGVDRGFLTADSKAGTSGTPTLSRAFGLLKIALRNPLMYGISFIGFLVSVAGHTTTFWLPIVINGLIQGNVLTNLKVAINPGEGTGALPVLLAAIPFTVGALTTWALAHSAQRRRELFFHVSIPMCCAGAIFIAFAPLTRRSAVAGFIGLVGVIGLAGAARGVGFALAGELCAGPAQAVAMPLFYCTASVGGFVGPTVAGAIVQATGGFTWVTVLMGGLQMMAGLLILVLRWAARVWRRKLAKAKSGLTTPGWGELSSTRKDSGPAEEEPPCVVMVGGKETGAEGPHERESGPSAQPTDNVEARH